MNDYLESEDVSQPNDGTSEGEHTEVSNPEENKEIIKEDEERSVTSDDSVDADSPEPAENQPEDEKIVFTKEQFNAEAAKIRKIAEKKAKRAAQRELDHLNQGKSDGFQQNTQQPVQQPVNIPPQPDANHIYDPTLNQWIPSNMSVSDYVSLANQQIAGMQQQPVNYGQPVQNIQQPMPQSPQQVKPVSAYSEAAENQAIECQVGLQDFEQIMKGAPVSPVMANAVAVDPEGLKNLYELMKTSPHEVYQISQLSPEEQKHRMWKLNLDAQQKKQKRVQSKATPQPAPLNSNGKINKSRDEMSYLELKRAKEREIWGT